jgi:DNA uptake protein ComE-like DNA-binding protein
LILVPVLLDLAPTPTRPGRPRPCARVITIDGDLHCDEELDHIETCPQLDLAGLRSGDAVSGCTVDRMQPDALERLELPVDVNRADLDELASLPGIGPVLAERIIAGRPYASVDELDRVSGIGRARLAGLRARARVE